jgi:hypothetical protein
MMSGPTMASSVRIKKIPTLSDLGFVRFPQIRFEKVKKVPKIFTHFRPKHLQKKLKESISRGIEEPRRTLW